MSSNGKNFKEYFIGTKLGQGSYASVHKTRYQDKDGTTTIACKIFDRRKVPKDVLKKFFPRELEILRGLDNPHIIHLQSIVESEYKVFIFMTFAERGDLYHYLKSNGRISERRAREWFRSMVEGVSYLHGKNIVHRDLKCENVLITKDYRVLITDFGFSKFTDAALSETYCGSPMYAAPEIIKGAPYDPKPSDIWSLGVILYVMLNGKFPFDENSMSKLLRSQMSRAMTVGPRFNVLSSSVRRLIVDILEPVVPRRCTLDDIFEHEWMIRRDAKRKSIMLC